MFVTGDKVMSPDGKKRGTYIRGYSHISGYAVVVWDENLVDWYLSWDRIGGIINVLPEAELKPGPDVTG